jgi:hypothetical protein
MFCRDRHANQIRTFYASWREGEAMDDERWRYWQRQWRERWFAAMQMRLWAMQMGVCSRQLHARIRPQRLARRMVGANPLTVIITERILLQRGLLEPKRFTPPKTFWWVS